MSDDLTQNDVNVIENAANLFDALKRAARVARESIAIQQAMSDKRRALEALEQQIAAAKAELLDRAGQSVKAEQEFKAKADELAARLTAAQDKLNAAVRAHEDRVKAQDKEFAEKNLNLTREHNRVGRALQEEVDKLTAKRDAMLAELDRLKAKFA